MMGMIGYPYTKERVLSLLRNDWKIDEKILKKAYQLQKTLDIPKHYYDKEFEDKVAKKKTGRR
ncbi:MAG: hypothetical protein COB67_10480 [SAR324 cluster bacterium]|uniref:Uncharacterized protein n=1 Tax=SAR324 cluster bacterium TaxID=2024889 RepID=A0A2A4SXJ4_9DELT|nr:MAG: hypothetical protein COB67_10480 [SAR324 cluster bacterium]